MKAGPGPKNPGASIRARLGELARRKGVELQLLLSEFAIERLLYRLGASPYAERFVLKGATLFKLWSDERRRATWDLDLLGIGASGVADVAAVIRNLCEMPSDDAITFLADSVRGEEIRIPDEYAGVRVRLDARLDAARIPVQIDVGFGDAVVPAPRREAYPTLLDHEAPRILVYPREAVVAEKLEAIVSLGMTNSRMKDFYDLHRLASTTAFDGTILTAAIRATFYRRRVALPTGEPLAFSAGFFSAPERRTQWRAFLRRGRLPGPLEASELIDGLRRFVIPILEALARGNRFAARWPTGGPWIIDTEGEQ